MGGSDSARRCWAVGAWVFALLCLFMLGHPLSAVAAPPGGAEEGASGTLAPAPTPDPGNLDSLLNAAERDVTQLAKVNVMAPAMEATVSTVSRETSTVGRSAAAVFVITNEMIRRSGARTIPDVLRMAPGVNVARINANQWAVSIRGFNGLYANKLLVQIDGRSIYTPMFSGVFWDQNDVMLEDVERIEVIRGPGASVWGANAVNGVINIITKKASDTQGVLVQGGSGSEERGFGEFRVGRKAGEALSYRIYGKAFERGGGYNPTNAQDEWRRGQVGFRADWEPCQCTTVTLQGDYYKGSSGQCFDGGLPTPPFWQVGTSRQEEPTGGDVLFRMSRKKSEESDWALQLYYDQMKRVGNAIGFSQSCDTFDLDFQHRFPLAPRQSLIWGFRYRNTNNTSTPTYIVSFDPLDRDFALISWFLQDRITLKEDLLYLTLGSKFEHNDFSGFEYQPTARLLWTPSERRTIWASISRAVRTPSRTDQDIRVLGPPVAMSFVPPGATFMRFEGSRDVGSEALLAYEIGMRAQPSDRFWWDLAVFFNKYDQLVASIPLTPAPPAPTLPPSFWQMISANAMRGETYGFELASTYQMSPNWRLQAGYSYLRMCLQARPDAVANSAEDIEGASPQNQVYLQSGWDLGGNVKLDVMGRYVDSLPAWHVPSYVVMDVRLAWTPRRNLEIAVVGRNLLDSAHPEFVDRSITPSDVQSEVYGMATWRY
ncbi:MAG: TonB-dependent receptor [Pirellulales bacterium]|nr:TonB-dependent receptor [Pirellulales bacterium]